jgi:hypothetical protein
MPDEATTIQGEKPHQEPTFGMKAVGIDFNPSGSDEVNKAKQGAANLIDQMNELRGGSTSPEQKRLASVAITEFQTAQMWAVKAITWKD